MAAQLPDLIWIDGKQMDLYSNPLELYWGQLNKRPNFQTSPDCKRGYIATWEIRNEILSLTHVEAKIRKSYFLFWKKIISYSLKMLFKKAGDRSVTATWVAGKLRIPQGNRTLYVDEGYESRFECEMIITIQKAKVLKTVVIDYTKQELVVAG
ncbi:MAG: hypothetical protein JNM78_12565 [Cyclobacteriaceae bacterium]|nr:hypothetical protein [Cyclobacteriaceae bacterium]